MSTLTPEVPLLLQRVPDARKASAPLFPPVFFPYVALMLGSSVAAACAAYDALALRRYGLAAVAVAVGLLGWVGFGLVCAISVALGLPSVLLALLPARLLGVALGALLAATQWAHVRGHGFLDGKMVPLLPAVLAAFAIRLALPVRPRLVLEGLWQLLLR